MATEAPTIDTVLADLQRQREQLDPDSAEAQARQVANEIATAASALDNRIGAIRSMTITVKACDAKIAAELQWRETLCVIRAELCKELLALPPRIRDPKLLGVQQNLTLSITVIDRGMALDGSGHSLNTLRLGQLMLEHGFHEGPRIENQTYGQLPWGGSMREVETRLKKVRGERDAAQHRLGDALLDDAGRAAQAAQIAAKNAAPRRKTRGDGSVYLKFSDGHIEEVEL